MTSRLDRMVLLLDTGATPTVRAAAAEQLGLVQKQHPQDLYPLLSRVYIHLRSKSWETRIAAGLALKEIAGAVPIWNPEVLINSHNTQINVDLMAFDSFAISRVVERGVLLLSSQGKEFDDALLSITDAKERLVEQRRRLKERLGLGTQFMDVDFFDEGDVVINESAAAPAEPIVSEDVFAGLSARERNQLKRKQRMGSKFKSPIADLASSSLKKVKTENSGVDPDIRGVEALNSKETGVIYSDGDEWPFEGLCEQLCMDLFSPQWEIRHGAAIGLCDIMKIHGSGAGKIVGIDLKSNTARHDAWLEDLSIRILCVLALDRFADFVGDQAVIPVRETCAMTLAVVMSLSPSSLCLRVVNEGILELLTCLDKSRGNGAWEIRHASLIALKYWMAARPDLLKDIFYSPGIGDTPALSAIIDGLRDSNDDVRAVASSSLIPISSKLVELIPDTKIFHTIVISLWNSLEELDDLTAATSYVMDLLADLIKQPSVAIIIHRESTDFFKKLVPQMFPFVRHAIYSVRSAVIRTLKTLVKESEEENCDISWITMDLIRLLFQNFCLEERRALIDDSLFVWTHLILRIARIEINNQGRLQEIYGSLISVLFGLIMSPIGKPLEIKMFVKFSSGKRLENGSGVNISPHDRAMVEQDLTILCKDDIMYGRIAGLTALGRLISGLILDKDLDVQFKASQITFAYLCSGWACHRMFAAIIIEECAKYSYIDTKVDSPAKKFWDFMVETLDSTSAGAELLYQELHEPLKSLYNECLSALNLAKSLLNVAIPSLPLVPSANQPDSNNSWGPMFTISMGDAVNATLSSLAKSEDLDLAIERLTLSITNYKSLQTRLDTQVQMAFAAAIIALNEIPSKLNPIIRSLMNCIKFEENEQLQTRGAYSIAGLISLNNHTEKGRQINAKIVKNTCGFLCSDTRSIAELDISQDVGIETLKTLTIDMNKQTKKAAKKNVVLVKDLDIAQSLLEDKEALKKSLMHRGAELTIAGLCSKFNADLFEKVPKIWDIIADSTVLYGMKCSDSKSTKVPNQELADSLQIIEVLARYSHPGTFERLQQLVEPCIQCLKSKGAVVRNLASKAVASLCKSLGVNAIKVVLEIALPMANDVFNPHYRQGAVELIYYLVSLMEESVFPYLVFLIVPLLGRMSDSDPDVRFISTFVFAQLVKLSPLESGAPNPSGFTEQMIENKEIERKFIGQLIGSEKVSEFVMPVEIRAELRSYQKEGVSWLAFLNRYGLHGILCDDMGLGKTLQSICMMASDHFNRALIYKETKDPNKIHCPSIVVCPSTLTGHWFFEIKKYANLTSIVYSGDKASRASIRDKVGKSDVLIISYELLRNDIQYFTDMHFNYVILDEGHVIKNPKTKLTEAVKSVKAFHRLILSGTPIQNNVLELWSLFDFLMPGFLGTEPQFNERFGKPIMASRDAKSSSREQAQGALALEALHKQVLPFLMRRMKEDVLDDLPPKIIQDYYCDLNDLQRMLYEDFSYSKSKEGAGNELGSKEKKGSSHIFQALQYLRKLCNHPSFVVTEEHPQYQKVMGLLKKQGRKLIDIENSPKLLALQQLLLDCGIGQPQDATSVTAPHRCLIFAQHKQMIDMIENHLFKKIMPTVTFMKLDGATDGMKRHELVQTFNSDPSIDVLLLTTHVGGLGLNLTGADTVIFVEHDWNPMKDLQAMDRAHRIGQKRVVNVYRLITKGTLEEKIMGLQKFKMNIASSVINHDNMGISSMDTDQIMDLFNLGESKSEVNANSNSGTVKEHIAGLENLWDESLYEDMQTEFFKNS